MTAKDAQRLAEEHAKEAEKLLAGRMGFINNIIKADVHATLAVFYAGQAERPADALREA